MRQAELDLALSFLEKSDDCVVIQLPDLIDMVHGWTQIQLSIRLRIKQLFLDTLDFKLMSFLIDPPIDQRYPFRFDTPIGSIIFVSIDEGEGWDCPVVLVPRDYNNPKWLQEQLEVI